jgi:hypothetical protein
LSSIGENAFSGTDELKEIQLPKSIRLNELNILNSSSENLNVKIDVDTQSELTSDVALDLSNVIKSPIGTFFYVKNSS